MAGIVINTRTTHKYYLNTLFLIVLMYSFLGIDAIAPTTKKAFTTITYAPIEVWANSTGISVAWELVQGATDYHIIHGPTGNNENKAVRIVRGRVGSIWIPSSPNTLYTIEVVAILPGNVLKHVGSSNITTENGVFVNDKTAFTLDIWWGAVHEADEYHVVYHPVEQTKKKTILVAINPQIVIEGLKPSTRYSVEVVAVVNGNDFQLVGGEYFTTSIGAKGPGVDIPLVAGFVIGGFIVMVIVIIVAVILCRRCRNSVEKPDQKPRNATSRSSDRIYDQVDDQRGLAQSDIQSSYIEFTAGPQDEGRANEQERAPLPLPRPPKGDDGYVNPVLKPNDDAGYVSMTRSKVSGK